MELKDPYNDDTLAILEHGRLANIDSWCRDEALQVFHDIDDMQRFFFNLIRRRIYEM